MASKAFNGSDEKALLLKEILECRRCMLHKGINNKVPWEDSGKASIFFVGEAPGRFEDLQGRPFVGRAGKLLRRYLEAYKIKDYHITNVVKCRPPGNRTPTIEEMRTCGTFLLKEIQIYRPKIVVALGATALRFFAGTFNLKVPAAITRACCITVAVQSLYGSFILLPCYHPAAVLRDPAKEKDFKECFEKLKQITLRLSL